MTYKNKVPSNCFWPNSHELCILLHLPAFNLLLPGLVYITCTYIFTFNTGVIRSLSFFLQIQSATCASEAVRVFKAPKADICEFYITCLE